MRRTLNFYDHVITWSCSYSFGSNDATHHLPSIPHFHPPLYLFCPMPRMWKAVWICVWPCRVIAPYGGGGQSTWVLVRAWSLSVRGGCRVNAPNDNGVPLPTLCPSPLEGCGHITNRPGQNDHDNNATMTKQQQPWRNDDDHDEMMTTMMTIVTMTMMTTATTMTTTMTMTTTKWRRWPAVGGQEERHVEVSEVCSLLLFFFLSHGASPRWCVAHMPPRSVSSFSLLCTKGAPGFECQMSTWLVSPASGHGKKKWNPLISHKIRHLELNYNTL